jgi:O-Antigen ligase
VSDDKTFVAAPTVTIRKTPPRTRIPLNSQKWFGLQSAAMSASEPAAVSPGSLIRRASPPQSSTLALWTLVGLAVVSPWPFGSVEPWAVSTLTVVGLGVSIVVVTAQAWAGGLVLPRWPIWPLAALLGLAALQLLPLPPLLHHALAPGSYHVWHPEPAAAARVLGEGWRPISIAPDATRAWLAFVGALVLLGLLAIPAASVTRTAVRAATVVAASGVAVAVYGVLARVLFGPLLYGSIAVPTIAPFGPFVSKNHFAGYVEMGAIVALGLALGLARAAGGSGALDWTRSSRAWRPLLGFFGLAVIALAILVSLSRGGVVALSAGLLLFFGLRFLVAPGKWIRASVLPFVLALALVVGLLMVLPSETHERIGTLTSLGQEQSAPFRLRVWRDGLRAFGASPLVGFGAGAFADALAPFKSSSGELRIEHAENDYVELLVELGILGAAAVAAAVTLSTRSALAGYRRQRHSLSRRLGPASLAALGALLVHGLFDFNLRIPSNAVLFASIATLAAGLAEPPTETRARPVSIAVAAAAGAILVGVMTAGPSLVVPLYAGAQRVQNASAGPARQLRAARVEMALRGAVAQRPADPEPWLILAWLRSVEGMDVDAAQLAQHALALDPRRQELAEQAALLGAH